MTQNRTRGLINDSISDMLTRIRNACLAKKSNVSIPFTRLNQQIAQILEKEGFIQSFQISLENLGSGLPASPASGEISNTEKLESALAMSGPIGDKTSAFSKKTEILIQLKYRSKTVYQGKKKESCITNLKRLSKPGLRIYTNHREIPRILGGTGIVLLSTPEGIMTDREARFRGIGGELLCAVW